MDEPVSLPRRHTTPTHLFLPDKILFGFTARQLLLFLVGGSASYGLWLQLDVIPSSWGSPGLGLRLLLALPPALCCLLLAFVMVAGRPLELWGTVWLQFISQPKTAVWRRVHAQSRASRHGSVQAHLPIKQLLPDMVELTPAARGTEPVYAAVLRVQASSFALSSQEEQHAFIQSYQDMLLALRFPIQILVRAGRMNLSSYLRRLDTTPPDPLSTPTPLATPERQRVAQAHAQAIRELEQQRTLLMRRSYLVVCSQGEEPSLPWLARLPLIGLWSGRSGSRHLVQARRLLDMRVTALVNLLAEMGLGGERLTGHDLITLFDECLRGEAAVQMPLTSDHLAPNVASITSSQPDLLAPETLFSPVRPTDGDDEEAQWDEEGEHEAWNDDGEEEDEAAPFIPSNSVLDQLAPAALLLAQDHVQVGDDYVAGIAVTGLPREISEGAFAPLLHQEELMDLTLHLRPLASAPVLRKLMREQAQYRSTLQLAQRRGTPSDPDLAIAERDTEWLIPALASGEERLLEVGLYVQARASSLAALHARTERLLSTLHNSLLTAHKTTLEHWQSFQASLPTGRDPLSRTLTTTSSALSALLPFPEEALAMMETGVFVGVTPSGEPILLDPWGPGMDNPHEFWGGISGAGKSFAIKLRIIHETLVRPELQVIVIDPAGEYRQIAQAMGGHTIRIAPGSTQRINPFDLMPAGMNMERYLEAQHGDRLAEKIHNLHSFLDILLSDYTPAPTVLTAHEKSLLDKVLYECYRRVGITADPRSHDRPAPLLRDVSAVLAEGSMGTDTTGLAARLDRFVSGSLAGLFGRPTNVKLDAPVVAFDLREMRGGSELKPAGIFLISEFLWTQALFDKKPRRCYIDEAWSLIEHEAGGQFLERMAREFRKHYVSVVTITQNPEKFVSDPRGSVIAANAFTKVLKRLDQVGSQAARTAFGLSEAEEQRLTRLPQNKALLLVGSKRLLVEMRATPEEYRLAQTDPDATENKPLSPPALQPSPSHLQSHPFAVVDPEEGLTPARGELPDVPAALVTKGERDPQHNGSGETSQPPEVREHQPSSSPKRASRSRKKAASSPSSSQVSPQKGANS